jgi:transposase-like protein
MIRRKEFEKKQQIISEYLSGDSTLNALGSKYDVNPRTIQSWVRAFRKSHPHPDIQQAGASEQDMRMLKKQLEDAKLKNELLEEMLRLSEEHTGIDLRKKYGTRQS